MARHHAQWSLDDLPRTVAFTMHQGSAVTSMDFHPSHPTVLLGMKVMLFSFPIITLKKRSVNADTFLTLQLVAAMVTSHCGNLGCGKDW